MTESERTALSIYVAMARDASDAMDMINECRDRGALETLHKMLTNTEVGIPRRDSQLNEIMAGPVSRRLMQIVSEEIAACPDAHGGCEQFD